MVSNLQIKPQTGKVQFQISQILVINCMRIDLSKLCVHLYGGVKFVLISRFNSLQPLNNRLDVTADFTLERSGSSVVHSGVDGVSTSQNGFRVGALYKKTQQRPKQRNGLTISFNITFSVFKLNGTHERMHQPCPERARYWLSGIIYKVSAAFRSTSSLSAEDTQTDPLS